MDTDKDCEIRKLKHSLSELLLRYQLRGAEHKLYAGKLKRKIRRLKRKMSALESDFSQLEAVNICLQDERDANAQSLANLHRGI